ncbi:speedy protein A-like [Arapaima gigas]
MGPASPQFVRVHDAAPGHDCEVLREQDILAPILQESQRLPALHSFGYCDENVRFGRRRTPLHLACELLCTEMMLLLLGHSASPQTCDQDGANFTRHHCRAAAGLEEKSGSEEAAPGKSGIVREMSQLQDAGVADRRPRHVDRQPKAQSGSCSMRRNARTWCQTPASMTVRVKPAVARALQFKRGLRLKRPNQQENQGPPGKSYSSSRGHEDASKSVIPWNPILVIQRKEMAAFFKLFDDDLIQDFLWMDCCCKITDKYLLAMTFVYFKRARFSPSEQTRMNFFIALYLANTMEEDEEESKYEIFPWALGKGWRKQFPGFLRQRDLLWARIEYRAAVSRRCCEEVMAIVPSHFVWQRERAEHHSGAQRQYRDRGEPQIPRGPSASPVTCFLCAREGPCINMGLPSSSSHSTSCSLSCCSSSSSSPLPFALCLTLEVSPPRNRVPEQCQKKGGAHKFGSCSGSTMRMCSGSDQDSSLDWIREE